jgi:surface antigen
LITFRRWGPGYAYAWHVWVVIGVDDENGRVLIEEMNYFGKFIVDQRYVSMEDPNIIWYIY